jgi:hypothetical protein
MKGLIGHAEAAAAGFGETSLISVAQYLARVGTNAQLRILNPYLLPYRASRFIMPTDLVPRDVSLSWS